LVETLVLDRTDEPLGERVALQRRNRQLHAPHPTALEDRTALGRELRVAVHQQAALVPQEPIHRVDQVAGDLRHERLVGMRRAAKDLDFPRVPTDKATFRRS